MIPSGLLPQVDLANASVQPIRLPAAGAVQASVLRLDLIHPVISGNKWFKLKYYLQQALQSGKKGIITAGGAYSNHLLATAGACYLSGLSSVAVIRGEAPSLYSPTLLQLQQYNMQLQFVSRDIYRDKDALQQEYETRFSGYYWINEGGMGEEGITGAAEIMELLSFKNYTHIVCAVGTGTMMAGLLRASLPGQEITGIPVIKINNTSDNELLSFIRNNSTQTNFRLLYDFHEGGYAKKNDALLHFMNELYTEQQIPTDFVYTGKLFKAVFHLASTGYFPAHSNILIIHSGGLQGNRSLVPDTLVF